VVAGKKEIRAQATYAFQIQAPPKEGDAKLNAELNAELERVRKMTISAILKKWIL